MSARFDPADLPGWPRWLRIELAAAYVGVSRNTFLREVGKGIWPPADHRGGIVVWDRRLLDRKSDKRSGISQDGDFDWEVAHGDQGEGRQ